MHEQKIVPVPYLNEGTHMGAWAVVGLLCVCNFLNYTDRSALGGIVPALNAEWGTSHGFDGLLASVFIATYCVSSVLSAVFAGRFCPFVMMGWGMVVLMASAITAANAEHPDVLMFARLISGAAEGALQTVGPPVMQHLATRWQLVRFFPWWICGFSLAMNAGLAAGTAWAGSLSLAWRDFYSTELYLMLPPTALLFCLWWYSRSNMAPMSIASGLRSSIGGSSLSNGLINGSINGPEAARPLNVWAKVEILPPVQNTRKRTATERFVGVITNKVWMLTTVGYAMQVACQNGLMFWATTVSLNVNTQRQILIANGGRCVWGLGLAVCSRPRSPISSST